MDYFCEYESPLGVITMRSDGKALTGLWFKGQKLYGGSHPEAVAADEASRPGIFEETKKWLDLYFSGNVPDFTPELKIEATPFRKSVLDILVTVPYGQTVTYGEIARILASENGLKSMSAQAVGGAVCRNPVAIIIPCHRVVGSNGSLTGYAGGLDRKMKLLELEAGKAKAIKEKEK